MAAQLYNGKSPPLKWLHMLLSCISRTDLLIFLLADELMVVILIIDFFCNTVIALNSPYIADASHQILGVLSPLQMIVSALHAMIHDAITIPELCIYLHTGL